jgi:hypothetical protein
MAMSANAQLEFEAGQILVPLHALSDSGDHILFRSQSAPWSACAGFSPEVYPDGLVNGGAVTPAASGADDRIDVAALSAYIAGVLTLVASETGVSVQRASAPDTHRINALTVTSLGDIAVVAGEPGTTFSESRGADGGPPFIPVGDIEIAQVRLPAATAGPISPNDILTIWGQHCERWDYPAYQINTLDGEVEFASPLPLVHAGNQPKSVHAKVYRPVFQSVARALDFVPIEASYSATSQEHYGGVIGGSTSSLGQGKFTALLDDGHTDALIKQAGRNLTFRFKQDRNRSPYSLTQGVLGVARTYPKTAQVQASCTITGERATKDFPG